ncbi:MAG: hypothetical protein ABFS56_11980 [Pseudomonadota bacterium]
MSELETLEEEKMGSWAHSTTQVALVRLLANDGRFIVAVKLYFSPSQIELF